MTYAVAIIPARGGSKGLPRKNVRPICGKPLLAWTIEAALHSETVDRVIVSTDDAEIGQVAQSYGASVAWRPAEISGDKASSESALLHVLSEMSDDQQPDLIVFLQCTSPLTEPADIDHTVRRLVQEEADSAFSAADFHYFLWDDQREVGAVGINHDKSVRQLRQDRKPQFIETGAIYVMRTKGFLEHRHRFFGKTVLYEVPRGRVIEIDDDVDFQIAESLLADRKRRSRIDLLPKHVDAIVLDFDGVLTDDHVYLTQDGTESVRCSRSDGMGIGLAKDAGINLLILSKERNPVVSERATKLGIPVLQGIDDKLHALSQWLSERGLRWDNTIFVGNDINDTSCLSAAGCGVVVQDAHPSTEAFAAFKLDRNGGEHAVRELIDLVLSSKQKPLP